MSDKDAKVHVLYHDDMDGYASAWVVREKIRELYWNGDIEPPEGAPVVNWIAVQYNQPFPLDIDQFTAEDDVYIVDFSYPRDVMEKLHNSPCKLTVIDHHKSAKDKLEGIRGVTFDESMSGCELTWKVLYPELEVPYFIRLIGDRDTWKFKYGDATRYFHAGVEYYILTTDYVGKPISNLDKYFSLFYAFVNPKEVETTITAGRPIVKTQNGRLKAHFDKNNARVVNLLGKKIAFYQSIGKEAVSELGNYWVSNSDVDVALTSIMLADGTFIFSARSLNGQALEVIEVMGKQHGGGGHPNSCGFSVNYEIGLRVIKQFYDLPKMDRVVTDSKVTYVDSPSL